MEELHTFFGQPSSRDVLQNEAMLGKILSGKFMVNKLGECPQNYGSLCDGQSKS